MNLRKPKLAPAVICLLTFCIVTVVVVDAVMPFGYIFVRTLSEADLPIAVRVLLLAPIVGLLASSFVDRRLPRSMLTSASALALVGVWILGMILFVVYPMYPTEHPSAAKIVPGITSIPFLLAIIGTITHCVRSAVSGRAPQQFVGRERNQRVC